MAYSIQSNDAHAQRISRLRQRAAWLLPATRKLGEWVAREARMRAPTGQGRGRGALRRSLNHREPSHDTTILTSPLPYAKIQQEGGRIYPPGPLGARMLVMPLNRDAQAILDSLGASQSLRTVPGLVLVKTRRGRLVLIRQTEEPVQSRRKGERGKRRKHRMFGGQVLFVLLPKAFIPAQDYAPHADELQLRGAAAKFVREHLRGQG